MNADELLKMDNDLEIVFLRGLKPFICKKLHYSEYWMSEKIEKIQIEKYKEKMQIKTSQVVEEKLPTFEEFIKRRE